MQQINRTNYIATSEMYINKERYNYYIQGIKELNLIMCYIEIKDTIYLYRGNIILIKNTENSFEKEFELFLEEFNAEPDLRIHMYMNIYDKSIEKLVQESIKEKEMKIIDKRTLQVL